MRIALEEARLAELRGEIPVGAVLVNAEGHIIAREGNRNKEYNDPTAHAEILCIRKAFVKFKLHNLLNHSIYITLEPCQICRATLEETHIRRILYGASNYLADSFKDIDYKSNFRTNGPKYEVYQGICEKESSALLKKFFKKRRASKN